MTVGRKQNFGVPAEERQPKDRKLSLPGALTIVLLRPRIPQNTGAIARMCAATGSRLDLIAPFFQIDDHKLKRAGLDYWPLLDVRQFPDFAAWQSFHNGRCPWLAEVGGPKLYTEVGFAAGDAIMLGDEQEGIDAAILEKYADKHIRIPQQGVRSLNQAMAAGIVCFEALRQIKWLGLK